MKYYTPNRQISPKAQNVMLRILFIIIAAAVITFGTILVGHHLLKKAQALGERPSEMSGTGWMDETPETDPENSAGSAPAVRGVAIKLKEYPTDLLLEQALAAAAVSYDTVLYPLCGSDGSLIYQSPAVCSLVRIPLTDAASSERIKSAIQLAKMKGLRIIVSLIPSETVTDAALMKELADWGVNEILVNPNFSGSVDFETANRLRLYLIECGTGLDSCRLGTVLPAGAYLDPTGAMQIQMIAQASESLGIRFDVQYLDPGEDVYENVFSSLQALLGSFSVYNMRVVIEGDDTDTLSAQYQACVNRGIYNFLFTSNVDYADFEVREPEPQVEEEPDTVRPAQSSGVLNPYANTSETYEEALREAEETEPPFEATDTWNAGTTDWSAGNTQDGGSDDWSGGNEWDGGTDDWSGGNEWDSGTDDWSGSNEWTGGNEWSDGTSEWNAGNEWSDGSNDWSAGNDWTGGNEWSAGNEWSDGTNEWNAGNEWSDGSNDWNAGNEWSDGTNEWNAGNEWSDGSSDWSEGNEWYNPDEAWNAWDGNAG